MLHTLILSCSSVLVCTLFLVGASSQEICRGTAFASARHAGRDAKEIPSSALHGNTLALELIDMATEQKLTNIVDGTVYYVDAHSVSKLNVNLAVCGTDPVWMRIRAILPGSHAALGAHEKQQGRRLYTNLAHKRPFVLCGTGKKDFRDCPTLRNGRYSIFVTLYPRWPADNVQNETLTVSFTILHVDSSTRTVDHSTYLNSTREPQIASSFKQSIANVAQTPNKNTNKPPLPTTNEGLSKTATCSLHNISRTSY